jgi:hypothetical protein
MTKEHEENGAGSRDECGCTQTETCHDTLRPRVNDAWGVAIDLVTLEDSRGPMFH